MGLTSGTRLGPYEILALIGAGGMGEVYKARDTRLDRIVAIKVLPAHLADKPDLRERFEREARTIASLNHPHICTLYDIGRHDGIDFLVMEYLEGETLAMRLLKGPLPLEQVLQYAIEISDALDKAHRKGVTHRDIKPGNIMLIPQGGIGTKLLDFGLAKLKQAAAPASIPMSQLPTLKENPTIQGTLLGTLQYMSPEQVEGKIDEIDGRADIFAFGAVLHEMATGKRAFEGKSSASVLGAIMVSEPPPMSSLQPMTPPALERVVKRCLAKDRDERWQSAYDLWQ
ncbi:MAG TPA: serine/threonine-protein kinase, partial [Candidatus Acidoferrales bacterium]